MREYVWFRLLLILMGMFFLGVSVPNLVSTAAMTAGIAASYFATHFTSREELLTSLAAFVPTIIHFAFGLVLLVRSGRITAWCVRRALNRCPSCDYDLSATQAETCPECGLVLARPAAPPAKDA